MTAINFSSSTAIKYALKLSYFFFTTLETWLIAFVNVTNCFLNSSIFLSSALVTTDGLLVVSNKKIKIAQDYLPMANLSEH